MKVKSWCDLGGDSLETKNVFKYEVNLLNFRQKHGSDPFITKLNIGKSGMNEVRHSGSRL